MHESLLYDETGNSRGVPQQKFVIAAHFVKDTLPRASYDGGHVKAL
jgi:hypothetical protein